MPKMTTEQGSRDAAGGTKVQPAVLVIDDDNIARSLVRELLAPSCRVVELSSPIGATRTASAESVDVVLLDVLMPNLRGDMVAKLFRNNPRLRHVGVILISGCAVEELAEMGAECGADAVLSKRNLRHELVPTVARVSSQSRRRAPEAK
jgi:two-component system cell cycle response regulator DivK